MKNKNDRPGEAAELRRRAEEIAGKRAAQSPENGEAGGCGVWISHPMA